MWFVYTYIMYGDSDNDESSTNTHKHSNTIQMLLRTHNDEWCYESIFRIKF